jgi:hypothetical protein
MAQLRCPDDASVALPVLPAGSPMPRACLSRTQPDHEHGHCAVHLQWVFNNPACNGFMRFPTLGLQALSYSWNFDFQLSLLGLGIIAPLSVAWSLVVGAVVSWGLLWPVLSTREGAWFPSGEARRAVCGMLGVHGNPAVYVVALYKEPVQHSPMSALPSAPVPHLLLGVTLLSRWEPV